MEDKKALTWQTYQQQERSGTAEGKHEEDLRSCNKDLFGIKHLLANSGGVMMHHFGRAAACLLISAFCLGGCSSTDSTTEQDMYVSVNFGDMHRCSRISPEITVYNAPRETQYFEVRVTTAESPVQYLGGGRWNCSGRNEDNADVIPEGALVNSYRGPCPPSTKPGPHEFRYTISAMSRQSEKPLAVQSYTLVLDD